MFMWSLWGPYVEAISVQVLFKGCFKGNIDVEVDVDTDRYFGCCW